MKRLALVLLISLAGAVGVRAFDQPSVNLGFTSFLDGAPPAGPGFYYTAYGQYYHVNDFRDLPFQPDLDAYIWLDQLIYQSNQKVLPGCTWGLDLILPYVMFDLDNNPSVFGERSGFGDLLVGPYLQWDPIMGKNGPVLFNRVEFQCILPTGQYKEQDAINAGSNFFSFNPYWAATWLPAKKCEISWRLHYLWNDKNDKPWFALGADDTQAGQAIHLNFATSYEVIPQRLRLGVNGYYLKQITSSETDGVKQPGKEQVLGLGPGLLYSFSRNDHLFINAYFETAAESRTEGQRYNIRWVHKF